MKCDFQPTDRTDHRGRPEFACTVCGFRVWWFRPPQRQCVAIEGQATDFHLAAPAQPGAPPVRKHQAKNPWRALFLKYHVYPNLCGLGQREPADRCEYQEFFHCTGCGCTNPPELVSLTSCPRGKW